MKLQVATNLFLESSNIVEQLLFSMFSEIKAPLSFIGGHQKTTWTIFYHFPSINHCIIGFITASEISLQMIVQIVGPVGSSFCKFLSRDRKSSAFHQSRQQLYSWWQQMGRRTEDTFGAKCWKIGGKNPEANFYSFSPANDEPVEKS